ncbi:MAG: hypothetical protein U1F25_11010 [Rubrivivax sp.]
MAASVAVNAALIAALIAATSVNVGHCTMFIVRSLRIRARHLARRACFGRRCCRLCARRARWARSAAPSDARARNSRQPRRIVEMQRLLLADAAHRGVKAAFALPHADQEQADLVHLRRPPLRQRSPAARGARSYARGRFPGVSPPTGCVEIILAHALIEWGDPLDLRQPVAALTE